MPIQPAPISGPRRPELGGSGTQNLVVLVLVVVVLYFGRDIFVPIALAVVLSFALAPAVTWLNRRGLPRPPAVIAIVLLAFVCISAFGLVVAGQVSQLAVNLPQYQSNIQEKIRSIRSSAAGDGIVERASEMLRELGDEIEGEAEAPKPKATGRARLESAPEEKPVPVQIRRPNPGPLQLLQSVLGPLIEPMATGGIVIVFVIIMLLQHSDLRDRFIRLVGANDLHRTTRAIHDAGRRVARYFLMQLVVNTTYGIPVGIGLWLIGVPNPVLWGMLAMVLRFVPYIGPIISSMVPLALSIAVDSGWSMFLWTAALFVGLELISNNLVEPWLYGSSTGLSPLAVVAAAIFWTWLWGPVGLLLSTPLTVCLVVLGQHVPQFAFLDIMLGSEPVLSPPEALYQRLLAGDAAEATEKAEEILEEASILEFYDEVGVPAIALMEHDRARGVLDDDRRSLVVNGLLTLVDNLSEYDDRPDVERPSGDEVAGRVPSPEGLSGPAWRDASVLCVGGRGNLDDAASAMLAQLLERRGFPVRLATFDTIGSQNYTALDLDGVRLICLSFMNPNSLAHARYLVRRLQRRTEATILVGFWSAETDDDDCRDLLKATGADLCALSLDSAIDQALRIADTPARMALPKAG